MTLSQVILVTGLGSSWSQPLLAKRPSRTLGSGRKRTSSVPLAGEALAFDAGTFCVAPFAAERFGFSAACRGRAALSGTTPSCSAARQNGSKSLRALLCCCQRSEEHTSELQSPCNLVCRLLLEKKKPTPSVRAEAARERERTFTPRRVKACSSTSAASPSEPGSSFSREVLRGTAVPSARSALEN